MLALSVTLLPTPIAFQDLGALLARQPGVAARARAYLIASPFGTIHAATFSLPQPVGTAIPYPPVYALADFDPGKVARSIGRQFLGDPGEPPQFPTVNRRDKRNSLISRGRAPMPPMPPVNPAPPVRDGAAGGRFDPYLDYEFPAPVAERPAQEHADRPAHASMPAPTTDAATAKDRARVYFASAPLAMAKETIERRADGPPPLSGVFGDRDIKLAALAPASGEADKAGESVAAKGVVTGIDQRPQSPAERLALSGKTRSKAEKCLANAVYFEARGEPVRGQIAVAQVVMNRVFSPFYPDNVCGVVYQNADRHLACQFTFACDGVPDVVTEPDAWQRAKRIARDMLDGKLWLPQVSKATHYHAYWVHPDWVSEMHRLSHIGVHTFYRPRAWGDGAKEPSWGDPKTTAKETKIIKKL